MTVGAIEHPVFAMYPSLRGRTAFVSGGASGLGAGFVSQLAGQGMRVGFIDIDLDRGKALEQALRDDGADALFAGCDVRDVPALRAAISRSAEQLGPIRVLVNNAANDHRDKVAEMDLALWDDRIAVNLRHHFFAAQAVAEMMRDAGGGSIINLGSISAHIDLMDLPGYITAKAGIEGLTRTLAREYGPWHIRVNCIIPGWIMTEKQLSQWVTPEAEESIVRNQCLPDKVYPDDVARLLLWLAADDSRACTAQRWIVDGGWMRTHVRSSSPTPALSTARAHSGTRTTTGCCWSTCWPVPSWRSTPTAAPDDTSSEQLPRPSGLDAAAATCSPPRTNSRCSGPI